MKQFYDPDEYFLVADLTTRKLYVVHTIYKVLFKKNRSYDVFPCYLYEGKGIIKKEVRQLIARTQLHHAKELVSNTSKSLPKQLLPTLPVFSNLKKCE